MEDFYPLVDNKLNYVCVRDGEIYACDTALGNGRRPILYSENNVYWCLWTDNDKIKAVRSLDRGATWKSSGEFVMGDRVMYNH